MGWLEQSEGGECGHCGARSSLFVIRRWVPAHPRNREQWPEGFHSTRAHCLDRVACRARRAKRDNRARVRSSRLVLAEAPGVKAERQKRGHCAWCGEPMYRVNKDGETVLDRTRSYHNADRTERDCRTEHSQSYTFDARWALLYAARLVGATELRCVDCDARCSDLTNLYAGDGCVSWEADHELPLEDGGEHVIENLRCRCVPCHSAKTAHENVTRRRGRERAASPQLALGAT